MAYKIVVQESAILDANEYAAYIRLQTQSLRPAARWLDGLEATLQNLTDSPSKHRVIDEQVAFSIVIRQLIYHSHRVIYHVDESTKTVHILRIYHGARDALVASDIELA